MGKSHTGVFPISLTQENCQNSKTSENTDMKLELVTKLDKRNITTSKKFDSGVRSENFD